MIIQNSVHHNTITKLENVQMFEPSRDFNN